MFTASLGGKRKPCVFRKVSNPPAPKHADRSCKVLHAYTRRGDLRSSVDCDILYLVQPGQWATSRQKRRAVKKRQYGLLRMAAGPSKHICAGMHTTLDQLSLALNLDHLYSLWLLDHSPSSVICLAMSVFATIPLNSSKSIFPSPSLSASIIVLSTICCSC